MALGLDKLTVENGNQFREVHNKIRKDNDKSQCLRLGHDKGQTHVYTLHILTRE